jgi:hypothetical protein
MPVAVCRAFAWVLLVRPGSSSNSSSSTAEPGGAQVHKEGTMLAMCHLFSVAYLFDSCSRQMLVYQHLLSVSNSTWPAVGALPACQRICPAQKFSEERR